MGESTKSGPPIQNQHRKDQTETNAICLNSQSGLVTIFSAEPIHLISELDIYSLLRSRGGVSRGRYGRTHEMTLDLPQELVNKIYSGILLNFEMQN